MYKFQPGDSVVLKEQQAFGIIYKPGFIIDTIERRSIFVKSENSDESYVFDADSYSLEKDGKSISILTNQEYDEEFLAVKGGFNE